MTQLPGDNKGRPDLTKTSASRIHDPGYAAGLSRSEREAVRSRDGSDEARPGLVGRVKRLVPAAVRHRAVPPLGHLRSQYDPRPLRVPASYARVVAPEPAPSISVVIPSLDYGRYLGATLNSLLEQEYPDLELIVADGGSTDGTSRVLQRHSDGIARVLGGDEGQGDAINRGLADSSGEIMAWLNADDITLPGSLAFVARYFDRHPEVDVLYGNRVLLNDDGDDVGVWVTPRHCDDSIQWFDFIPQETVFWRRSIWERTGGIDTRFDYGFDWELFLRFQRAGATFARTPRFLGAFRQHDDQKTRTWHGDAQNELETIRCRHHERRVGLGEAQARAEKLLLKAGPHHLLRKTAWHAPRRSIEVDAAPDEEMAKRRLAAGAPRRERAEREPAAADTHAADPVGLPRS